MDEIKEILNKKEENVAKIKEAIKTLEEDLYSTQRKSKDLKEELRLKRIELIMIIYNLLENDLNKPFTALYKGKRKKFGKMEIEPETEYYTVLKLYPINKDNTLSKSYIVRSLDVFKEIIWED